MFHVILLKPEIPQNTGNIGRLCAITGSRLHLIHPLGFKITDRHLKRSGMDYWESLDWYQHESWEAFLASEFGPTGTIYLYTTHAARSYWDVAYHPGDGLLFGNEGSGVPPSIDEWAGEARVRIPQWNERLRFLNLSTAAGIATYEALRQQNAGGRFLRNTLDSGT